MSTDLTVHKGDFGYYLYWTLQDSDAVAFDLAAYTAIEFHVWDPNDPDTLLVDDACSVVVAADGTCKYLVADGDFDTAGRFRYEVEITKSGAKESWPAAHLTVEASG